MAIQVKETKGLKRLTKAGSVHVRMGTSGKMIQDNLKPRRKYKVKGE